MAAPSPFPAPDPATRTRVVSLIRALKPSSPSSPAPLDPAVINDLDDLLEHAPVLLNLAPVARSPLTLAHRIGEQGWNERAHRAIDHRPDSAAGLITGALRGGHADLAWDLLLRHDSAPTWALLDDPTLRRPLVSALLQPAWGDRVEGCLTQWQAKAPESLSASLHEPRTRQHPATQALHHRNLAVLQRLLEKGLPTGAIGADPRYPGSTLVHEVAYQDWADGIALLVAQGVDLNVRNGGGRTPLLLATTYERWQAAQALVQGGANVHELDPDHKQALWHVASHLKGNPSLRPLMVDLMKAGADPHRPEGKTTKATSVAARMTTSLPKTWALIQVRLENEVLRGVMDDQPLAISGRNRRRL